MPHVCCMSAWSDTLMTSTFRGVGGGGGGGGKQKLDVFGRRLVGGLASVLGVQSLFLLLKKIGFAP